ncbi:MAG: ATP-binding protein [Paraglaciecola sp.]|uniref:PAS domain-containing hybrid sensor histidine kinase/response regulator n=1 Tax=Paraglaciecola sp. TaxID=1920173 RepID=UPI0032984F00
MNESEYRALVNENKKLKSQINEVCFERDKYKKLFDISADALSIIDMSTGTYIECNSSAVAMHGVDSEESFLKLTPADLSPELQPCGRKSNYMAMEYIQKALQGQPQVFQWQYVKLDGSTFPSLVSLTAIPVGDRPLVLAVGRDLSDLVKTQIKLVDAHVDAKHFERAYLLEKEKFKQFVNLAPVGVAINRIEDGLFDYANQELIGFSGYELEELNALSYWQLTPEKYKELDEEQHRLLTATGRYGPYIKEYIHKSGHSYPVQLSGIKIKGEDGKDYTWSVIQDISERHQTESLLREAKQQAESSNNAKSLFVSNMSHEIRTPLNAILGILQLLQRDINNSKNQKLIPQAIYSANSLLRIINDILDYSKIEANQLTIENVEFSILNITESVISDMLPIALSKDLGINICFEENIPRIWIGDPVRIRQILLNLVSNAIKFTEEGGVTIRLSDTHKNSIPGVAIELTDTGIGMSEEALSVLFERFTQADASITRKFGGTGLGMSITKDLVSLMEGDISIKSTEGKGTTFTIFLPLKKSTKVEVSKVEAKTIEVPDLSDKRILIAEDNIINQEIIKSMLQETNAELYFAENGEEAVSMFGLCHPDIILMDIQMPIMDGKQAFRVIRQHNTSVPIVALTANVMSEDIEEYKSMGFTGFLGKPFDLQNLYSYLKGSFQSQ